MMILIVLKKKAIKKFPNSANNEHFRLLILSKGYDGIRYFDPITTGEEFVVFNTKKIKLVKKLKTRKEDFI